MMPKRLITVVLVLLLGGVVTVAQSTQPAASERAALELRAMEEFNRGNYALALPMLENLAVMSRDNPEIVGPILEKIRVCNVNIAEGRGGVGAPDFGGPRKPHTPPENGEILEMPITDLGNFDYDADNGGNIPRDVVALSGSMIRLTGFMIPMDQAENITQFALVPSLFACCFGLPPTIQHTVVVNCPKGKAVSYYPDEIVVEGRLSVEEKKEDGFIISIFEMEVSSVKPAAK
jgi:hypothetical protein